MSMQTGILRDCFKREAKKERMEINRETVKINGKKAAAAVRAEVASAVRCLREQGKRAPKLSVILVGEDAASRTYVKGKEKACQEVGIESETIVLPAETSQDDLLQAIRRLNEDSHTDGILVQLPLPPQIDEEQVVQAIDPDKDVDGFHIRNVGKLTKGKAARYLPCTPSGIIELLHRNQIPIEGKHCVVIGRSNLVGKPLALLLLEENGTVTLCHSKTADLSSFCRSADILVVATGNPRMIHGSMIKPGAVVIDVGIHRGEKGLCGDVDTESCMGIASAITPVPGGVGPMTVAMLMKNCLEAYRVLHAGRAEKQ